MVFELDNMLRKSIKQKLVSDVPVGAFSELENGLLKLRGFVGDPDGSQLIFADMQGAKDAPNQTGYALAEKLLAQGAARILEKFSDV